MAALESSPLIQQNWDGRDDHGGGWKGLSPVLGETGKLTAWTRGGEKKGDLGVGRA